MKNIFSNPLVLIGVAVAIALISVRLDSMTRVKPHKKRMYFKASLLAIVISLFHLLTQKNTPINNSLPMINEEILGGEF